MVKGNFYNSQTNDDSALGRIKNTLNVDKNGSVTFKTNLGRGSGTPVYIPGDSFDAFVTMMQEVATKRADRAEQARQQSEPTQSTDTDDDTTSEE